MSATQNLNVDDARTLAANALIAAGAAPNIALSVANALIAAQVDGQVGHGLIRLPAYVADLREGRVDGTAEPSQERPAAGYISIDARDGFAYPAIELAVDAVSEAAGAQGIAAVAIRRSHHAGQCGRWVEQLALRGCIGMMFVNARAAMTPHGGNAPLFGTNPIAFAAPRQSGPPLIIDLSLSTVARGKILAAEREGRAIPEGWAVDQDGNPTTDPKEALAGSLLPLGGAKGTALALMVEILAFALTGANSSVAIEGQFAKEGAALGMGQTLIAVDIRASAGEAVLDRIEHLAGAIEAQDGAHLPGARRAALRETAATSGINISADLFHELGQLAARSV